MQLVYESEGKESPPWLVVSVKDTSIAGIDECRVMVLKADPNRAEETRRWCARGDTLWTWDAASKSLKAIRPTGEGMNLQVIGANGSMSTYNTRSGIEQFVSGTRIPVVETVVTTRDSLRRTTRRLREFYAPGLATATSGVFEVPDSTPRSGGWRIVTSFKLVRIDRF